MNSLSWMILFAEMVDKFQGISTFFSIMYGIFLVVIWFVRVVTSMDVKPRDFPGEYDPEGSMEYQRWNFFRCLTRKVGVYVFFGISLFLAVFLPSGKTLYLITASEVAGRVLTTPESKETFNDIRTILKQQIKEDKKQ